MPRSAYTLATYAAGRGRRPPAITIGDLRNACGLTLADICKRLQEITGRRWTAGAISGIENGHRGASKELLTALELAYGLQPGSITTEYAPRSNPKIEIASLAASASAPPERDVEIAS